MVVESHTLCDVVQVELEEWVHELVAQGAKVDSAASAAAGKDGCVVQ